MAVSSLQGPEDQDRRDSKDSPISVLSREVLEVIFQYIYDTSPLTLNSLTKVNRVFYASTYALKHRDQFFIFKEDMKDQRSRRNREILTGLLTDSGKRHILLSIRSITVNSMPKPRIWRNRTEFDQPNRQAHEKKWLLFADLLSKIPHLKSFILHGTDQLSDALLDALERHHPQAELHIRNWTRLEDDRDHKNAAELALARSSNLRSLQARLWDTTSHIDLREVALKRIVALSPKLEELDISEGSSGLVVRDVTTDDMLEESKMREEFWSNIIPASHSIRSLRSRGGEHLTLLRDTIDTSQLESLDMSETSEIHDFGNPQWPGERFTQLKHFMFAFAERRSDMNNNTMVDFLYSCNSLESLGFHDFADRIPLRAIYPHGDTLRNLVLHNTEKPVSGGSRQPISLAEIRELSGYCRLIEDITIDGDKSPTGEGFNEILSALALFPLLHTIRIYLPLGVAEEADRTPHMFLDEDETRAEIEAHCSNPFNPIEDSCWLENAWSLLRCEKKNNGSVPLRELHVKVGEWERELSSGYPAGWAVWEAAHRRYFIATPHERDDRPDDINIYIKGTKPYSNVDSHEVRRIPDPVDHWN